MDNIMTNFGIHCKLGADNGPPFKSQDFANFAKHMGFKHTRVTPHAPWAKGTVEYFTKNLVKVLKTSHIDYHNWRQPFNVFAIPTEPHRTVPWGTHQRSFYSTTDKKKSTAQHSNQRRSVLTQGSPRKQPTPESRSETKGRQQSLCEDCQSTDRWQSAMSTTKTKQTNISVQCDTIYHHKDKR